MTQPELFQIVYSSTASKRIAPEEIRAILETARAYNPSKGVTGLLLHDGLHFFQVLKGPKDAVESLYDAIAKDRRHANVVRILAQSIPERNFADWSMAYSEASPEELREIDGLSDHFRDGGGFANLQKGHAKLLINAFLNGILGNRSA